MFRWRINLRSGEMLSRWYGVSHGDFQRDVTVCYPIPFNLIVRWGRNVLWWLRAPGLDCRNEEWKQGYAKGFDDARARR